MWRWLTNSHPSRPAPPPEIAPLIGNEEDLRVEVIFEHQRKRHTAYFKIPANYQQFINLTHPIDTSLSAENYTKEDDTNYTLYTAMWHIALTIEREIEMILRNTRSGQRDAIAFYYQAAQALKKAALTSIVKSGKQRPAIYNDVPSYVGSTASSV